MQKVRLSDYDLAQITELFKKYFGSQDHLWVFGSRVDLSKRGGDIDLYIETIDPIAASANKKRTQYIIALWDAIGEQKIDIVLNLVAAKPFELPIYKIAREEGVQLV